MSQRTSHDEMKGMGIYQITHRLTGQFYIGSSVNLANRKRHHINDLRSGTHGNHRLMADYVDDTTFRFTCLERLDESTDYDLLLLLEQTYIDCCNPYYNLVRDVFSCIPGSKSHIWIVTRPDGTEITVVGLSTYCRLQGLCCPAMLKVAKGKTSQHKGYRCRRLEDAEPLFVPKGTHEGPRAAGFKMAKPYLMTHPDGRQEQIIGLNAFCAKHGLRRDKMRTAIKLGCDHRGFYGKRLQKADPSVVPSTLSPSLDLTISLNPTTISSS